eukprot:14371397-Alexandrium_andersonii.AAC.1
MVPSRPTPQRHTLASPVFRALQRGHLQWPGLGSLMGVPGRSRPHCRQATRSPRTESSQRSQLPACRCIPAVVRRGCRGPG